MPMGPLLLPARDGRCVESFLRQTKATSIFSEGNGQDCVDDTTLMIEAPKPQKPATKLRDEITMLSSEPMLPNMQFNESKNHSLAPHRRTRKACNSIWNSIATRVARVCQQGFHDGCDFGEPPRWSPRGAAGPAAIDGKETT